MLLCCEAMVWAATFITFPVRFLASADRKRKLDRLLGEMQGQMERVVWENRGLEQRLRAALKENAAMEGILDEMDEEHEVAFARINSLESQLKALKKENMRLKEQRGKSMCDTVAVAGSGGGKKKAGEPVAWEAPAGKVQEEEEEDAAAQKDQAVVYRSGDLDAIPASEAQARLLRATARDRVAGGRPVPAAPRGAGPRGDHVHVQRVAPPPRARGPPRPSAGVRRLRRRRRAAEPQLVPAGRADVAHAPRRGEGRRPARRAPSRPLHRVARRRRASVREVAPQSPSGLPSVYPPVWFLFPFFDMVLCVGGECSRCSVF